MVMDRDRATYKAARTLGVNLIFVGEMWDDSLNVKHEFVKENNGADVIIGHSVYILHQNILHLRTNNIKCVFVHFTFGFMRM